MSVSIGLSSKVELFIMGNSGSVDGSSIGVCQVILGVFTYSCVVSLGISMDGVESTVSF